MLQSLSIVAEKFLMAVLEEFDDLGLGLML